jgi:hypothetical protein
MNKITFEEWKNRFKPATEDAELALEIVTDDEGSGYSFYENGAIKDEQTGEFVIKSDEVRPI